MARLHRRRRVSLTSLIDVIFLLLLFFMLTSTFSKFAEVDLTAGGGGRAATPSEVAPLFLRLGVETVLLNGQPLELEALAQAITALGDTEGRSMLVSLQGEVTSQRLTDVLVTLRSTPGLQVSVLGAN